jgi:hypothetical protein
VRRARSDLTTPLPSLVGGAVHARALLDRGWDDAFTCRRDIVQSTAPVRQVLQRYAIDCSLRLRVEG